MLQPKTRNIYSDPSRGRPARIAEMESRRLLRLVLPRAEKEEA